MKETGVGNLRVSRGAGDLTGRWLGRGGLTSLGNGSIGRDFAEGSIKSSGHFPDAHSAFPFGENASVRVEMDKGWVGFYAKGLADLGKGVAVDLYLDEVFESAKDGGIGEGGSFHLLTDAAPGGAEVYKQGFVLLSGDLQRLIEVVIPPRSGGKGRP